MRRQRVGRALNLGKLKGYANLLANRRNFFVEAFCIVWITKLEVEILLLAHARTRHHGIKLIGVPINFYWNLWSGGERRFYTSLTNKTPRTDRIGK